MATAGEASRSSTPEVPAVRRREPWTSDIVFRRWHRWRPEAVDLRPGPFADSMASRPSSRRGREAANADEPVHQPRSRLQEHLASTRTHEAGRALADQEDLTLRMPSQAALVGVDVPWSIASATVRLRRACPAPAPLPTDPARGPSTPVGGPNAPPPADPRARHPPVGRGKTRSGSRKVP